MTTAELASREDELAIRLERTRSLDDARSDEEYQHILNENYKIYQAYVLLAPKNLEALKRALFMQWISLSDLNYITGISVSDEDRETLVTNLICVELEKQDSDEELKWMITYYLEWDWIFERFQSYNRLRAALHNNKAERPFRIDEQKAARRGAMGSYWNSITNKH